MAERGPEEAEGQDEMMTKEAGWTMNPLGDCRQVWTPAVLDAGSESGKDGHQQTMVNGLETIFMTPSEE